MTADLTPTEREAAIEALEIGLEHIEYRTPTNRKCHGTSIFTACDLDYCFVFERCVVEDFRRTASALALLRGGAKG